MSDAVRTTQETDDEVTLMGAVGAGDPRAYRVLADRHFPIIYRFAARLLVDRSEAEDVTQETFLRLWQHAERWTPDARLSTWLHRVAKNLCLDRLRRRRDDTSTDVDALPSSQRPSALLVRKRIAERVQAALAQLPVRQRLAVTLVHYQGLSQLEAAEVMELNLRALESLLARGRRTLRAQLAEHQSEATEPQGDVQPKAGDR